MCSAVACCVPGLPVAVRLKANYEHWESLQYIQGNQSCPGKDKRGKTRQGHEKHHHSWQQDEVVFMQLWQQGEVHCKGATMQHQQRRQHWSKYKMRFLSLPRQSFQIFIFLLNVQLAHPQYPFLRPAHPHPRSPPIFSPPKLRHQRCEISINIWQQNERTGKSNKAKG
jgi:hypothetical protein